MREPETITLTANDWWELRRLWHLECAEKNHNDMTNEERHHIAVCDALESMARCAESVGEPDHVCDFTGRVIDVISMLPCIKQE